jgi:hypothetical protein
MNKNIKNISRRNILKIIGESALATTVHLAGIKAEKYFAVSNNKI